MRLLLKFNLAFGAVSLAGIAAAGAVSWTLLERNARQEVEQDARLLMESAAAQRNYTVSQIKPLLGTQMKYTFLPQTVPDFAATELFAELHKRLPEFSYKEAALNPTNPRDRAAEWEAEIVRLFRSDAGRDEISGERETPAGGAFYVARPIRIREPACLECHSSVEAAPATLVEKYGSANGFGWKLNDVIGAQLISVPADVPLRRATEAFRGLMLAVAVVLLAIGGVLNLMLWRIVIRPVSRLSALANQVSNGDLQAPEFATPSRDEIGELAASFARMRKSVDHAVKLLDT
jgi:HAMP domain-containing protein